MSKRVGAAERLEWVRRWRASGLSCERFAARHGLSKATLYSWSHQVGRSASVAKPSRVTVSSSTALSRVSSVQRPSSRPSFTQVRVVGSASSGPSVGSGGVIEVVLGDGRSVRVHGTVNESALRTVLRVVSEC